MSLGGDIVTAGSLDQIHEDHAQYDPAQRRSDDFCRIQEEVLNTEGEDQGIGDVDEGDNDRTQHVQVKGFSVGFVKRDKVFDGL